MGIYPPHHYLQLSWIKNGDPSSWLVQNLPSSRFPPPFCKHYLEIEHRAELTQRLGNQKLWEGYGKPDAIRDSETVRSDAPTGNFYAWLVTQWRPEVVVEFGTAFGISGMYWLSGLESAKRGELLTFEPNQEWAAIARGNLKSVGTRYQQIVGTFEDRVDGVLAGRPIDIAFIDAIHTSEFVNAQFEIVRSRLRRSAIVLFDDIDFSDDMRNCWREIAQRQDVKAAVELRGHLGIVEI